jgi:hypothetical protein
MACAPRSRTRTPLAKCEVATISERLIKIGARVINIRSAAFGAAAGRCKVPKSKFPDIIPIGFA